MSADNAHTHTWQSHKLFNNQNTRRIRDNMCECECGCGISSRVSVAHVMLELSKPKSTSINHRKFINYSAIDNGCVCKDCQLCVSVCVCVCKLWLLKYAWDYFQIDACPCQQISTQNARSQWLNFSLSLFIFCIFNWKRTKTLCHKLQLLETEI